MDSKTSIRRSPIDRARLDTILKHPDVSARNAWELFITYFWDKLRSECYQMRYDDEDPDLVPDYSEFSIDGMKIDRSTFMIMLKSSAEDYLEAMHGRMTVRIDDRPFRVPSDDSVTYELLVTQVFMFKGMTDDDLETVTISKDRVYTFEKCELADPNASKRENRKFFHKLTWLIECTDDGWDTVTDMEAAAYMWGYNMYRHEGMPVKNLPVEVNNALAKIEKVVGMDNSFAITDCWETEFRSAVVSVDTQFSAEKVRDWNARNRQKSIVDGTDEDKAEDYWYNKCDTFRI